MKKAQSEVNRKSCNALASISRNLGFVHLQAHEPNRKDYGGGDGCGGGCDDNGDCGDGSSGGGSDGIIGVVGGVYEDGVYSGGGACGIGYDDDHEGDNTVDVSRLVMRATTIE